MSHSSTIACLREALRGPLPGLAAQMGMAPIPRPGTERILDPYLDCRRAGVLVLLYPCDAKLSLVLTRRTDEYIPLEERTTLKNRNRTDGVYGIYGHDLDELVLTAARWSRGTDGTVTIELHVES